MSKVANIKTKRGGRYRIGRREKRPEKQGGERNWQKKEGGGRFTLLYFSPPKSATFAFFSFSSFLCPRSLDFSLFLLLFIAL